MKSEKILLPLTDLSSIVFEGEGSEHFIILHEDCLEHRTLTCALEKDDDISTNDKNTWKERIFDIHRFIKRERISDVWFYYVDSEKRYKVELQISGSNNDLFCYFRTKKTGQQTFDKLLAFVFPGVTRSPDETKSFATL